MCQVIYVTGGARSGKSGYALELALHHGASGQRVFIATAEAFDDEMRDRIKRHRDERAGAFTTIEEPLFLDRVLRNLPEGTSVVLLDCLTVWLGNLMHHFDDQVLVEARFAALLDVLRNPPCEIIVVSNEVGMGIVPENALARRFRDLAGTLNRRVAECSSRAYLLCSGIPLVLKQP
ncbi:MAG: bifunctional adenosylcobinamide kinase/adenosylcobinamide-phosphate guanylyltransferase [Chlorobiaceae bacterium]|nr:bifunctional adenosylcobinamide kinase/adenosylcobinamide-phosphate guanylyltransferase [Chlorobiaceae bacterium]